MNREPSDASSDAAVSGPVAGSGRGPRAILGARRTSAVVGTTGVSCEPLRPGAPLPVVIRPTVLDLDLAGWASAHRDWVESRVLQHGAVLFRGFPIGSTVEFERVIAALSSGAVEYRHRASPRTLVGHHIYTSTEYPPDQSIFPHNEHAFSPVFPLRVFFHCAEPATTGGETPLGDGRRILARIPASIRDRFATKQVMYVRNYNDGFGLPWQVVFQTSDPAEVERYCGEHGIEVEWKSGQRLRTRQVGPAIARHPRTGEILWFNHATFFHVSTLPPAVAAELRAHFREDELPTHTCYGDGSAIEPDVIATLRQAYLDELVLFPWSRGDVVMLDNMLTVHGRRPFTGARRILVGMADPTRWHEVRVPPPAGAEPGARGGPGGLA